MIKVHLVIPMAGLGNRFAKEGYNIPKPLITINDKPFFFWATKSITQFMKVEDITFIVLQEHIEKYDIDKIIKMYFENAKIVSIPEVQSSVVLTCMKGIQNINDSFPLLFNDCDHLFYSKDFYDFCNNNDDVVFDGSLLHFSSHSSNYSYLDMNNKGNVTKTVEKVPISNFAICGAYLFKNKDLFLEMAQKYMNSCKKKEYFLSEIYNIMIYENKLIKSFHCKKHLSFGTPVEFNEAKKSSVFKDFI